MVDQDFVKRARVILSERWSRISESGEAGTLGDFVSDAELIGPIRRSVNGKTKTYRYVLPAQILAKMVDGRLDCRCLQSSRGGSGAFDARTLAHAVVVPFDRSNEGVLGNSSEPYVNNPLRKPEVSSNYRDSQKDKAGWDELCRIVDAVEERQDPEFTNSVFSQILKEIYLRLQGAGVRYPVPRRVSLNAAIDAVDQFLAAKSGGDRFESVTAALFRVVGRRFSLYDDVRRTHVTTADLSAGSVADIECVSDSGEILIAVEAKDRAVTIAQVQDKIPGLRERKVSEAFFVASQSPPRNESTEIRDLIESEFASGQNIYVADLRSLCRAFLALFGETGRRDFLEAVGHELDRFSEIHHRRAWADALSKL